tara:strand:+ start:278 stop:517 length:240 start_codon:yes stop_codon:yes gene_type:complete
VYQPSGKNIPPAFYFYNQLDYEYSHPDQLTKRKEHYLQHITPHYLLKKNMKIKQGLVQWVLKVIFSMPKLYLNMIDYLY